MAEQMSWQEFRAIEHYFLETGRDFVKLSPTERRKRIEKEYERRINPIDGKSQGDFSLIPGPGRNNGGFDFQE